MRLIEGIEKYVAQKRAAGLKYTHNELQFRKFAKHIGDLEFAQITTEQLTSYMGRLSTSSPTWHSDFLRLQKFFDYWTLRGETLSCLMPSRSARCRPSRIRHIYSSSEICKLLDATDACQARASCVVEAATFRMYLIFLYATGTTVCESLDLTRGDLDLHKRIIAIRNRKYGSSRQIPIGDDLKGLLRTFLRRRSQAYKKGDPLFADRNGRFIQPQQITFSFSRARGIAGLNHPDRAKFPPRLLDFRNTFAVHRIRSWIEEGSELNLMLPALAVYLGQSGLATIDKYLDLTPECFKKHLAILSPKSTRRRWKDDPALSRFLNVT